MPSIIVGLLFPRRRVLSPSSSVLCRKIVNPSSKISIASQQFEIIQLIPILHDVPLDLASHAPRHEILRRPRHKKRRIRDRLRAHPHMALLDHLSRRLYSLCHPKSRHYHRQSTARKGGDRDAVFDSRQLGFGGQYTHIVQLVEEELFVFATDCVVGR